MVPNRYFFNPIKISFLLGINGLMTMILMAYSQNPPKGKTGAPGETTCMAYHNFNAGYEGTLSIEGLPSIITPNETYTLTVKAQSTGTAAPVRGGFQLVVIDSLTQKSTGTLTVTDLTHTGTQTNTQLEREYLNLKGAQLFNNDEVSWEVEWTAPALEGKISFYASAVIGNGVGSGGDLVNATKTIPIVAPDGELEVVIDNIVLPACHGGAATAYASVSGGTAPYQYAWSNGETTATASNLTENTYYLTVTDIDGLVSSDTVVIDDPSPINVSTFVTPNQIFCGDTVVLTASAVGGTGALTFVWEGAFEDSLRVSAPGLYCVVVTDENGCTAIACQSVNQDGNSVFCNGISTAGAITCVYPSRKLFPGVTANDTITYSWTGPDGFETSDTFPTIMSGGLYELTATIPNGCSCTSSIEVEERLALDIEVQQVIDATCGANGQIIPNILAGAVEPFSSIPEINADSLAKGDYVVVVTNGDGCMDTVEFSIGGVAPITIAIDEVLADHGSNDGAISITASGGVAPYDFVWKLGTTDISTDEDPMGLASGFYQLSGSDNNDCPFTMDSIEVVLVSDVVDVASAKNISLAPNPAGDYFVIKNTSHTPQLMTVRIFNINHQLVKVFEWVGKEKQIDLSSFPAGVYQVLIQSGNKRATKQLIVRK